MKKWYSIVFAVFLFLGCKKEEVVEIKTAKDVLQESTMTDARDGEQYKTVIVGKQEWMVENLRYRKKLGSMDGCWSYDEAAVDTTKVVVNKASFSAEVLKLYPTINKFGHPYMWAWIAVSDAFINSRGAYYSKSWAVFRREYYDLYYGGVATYEPFTIALEKIATDLKEEALINTLNAAVVKKNVKKYGYLYEYKAMSSIAPKGWRVPTDADFINLEKQLSISDKEMMLMEEWRASASNFQQTLIANNDYAGTIISGINNQRTGYRNKGFRSYYWTSTLLNKDTVESDAIIRAFQLGEKKIYRGTNAIVQVANSVICVRDID